MEIAGGSGHATGHTEIGIEYSPPLLTDEFSIYRVPRQLRHINEAPYTPQMVSIGPFHHGKTELDTTEAVKAQYLEIFLQWTQVDLPELFKFVEERETRLRNCYAEPIVMNNQEFLKMILLDTVFIISILLKSSFGDYFTTSDGIWSKPWRIDYIRYDLCLIENQLPLFIVDELLKFSGILPHFPDCSTMQLVHKFLKDTWHSWVSDDILEKVSASNYKIEHFVDYLRVCQKPQVEKQLNDPVAATTRGAFQWYQAGVDFRAVKADESHSLFDLRFDGRRGILEIPKLVITDKTELILTIIRSFEHCHCKQEDRFFADYIYAMGNIIRDDKDLELLIENDIIENRTPGYGGSFFKDLCKATPSVAEDFYFSDVFQDLEQHSRSINGLLARMSRTCPERAWSAAGRTLLILSIWLTMLAFLERI